MYPGVHTVEIISTWDSSYGGENSGNTTYVKFDPSHKTKFTYTESTNDYFFVNIYRVNN
jgi:hypothetical protein